MPTHQSRRARPQLLELEAKELAAGAPASVASLVQALSSTLSLRGGLQGQFRYQRSAIVLEGTARFLWQGTMSVVGRLEFDQDRPTRGSMTFRNWRGSITIEIGEFQTSKDEMIRAPYTITQGTGIYYGAQGAGTIALAGRESGSGVGNFWGAVQ